MKTRKVFYLALFAFTYLSAFGLQPVKKGKSKVGVQPLQEQQVAKLHLYEGEDSVQDTICPQVCLGAEERFGAT